MSITPYSRSSILQGAHNTTINNSTIIIREDRIAAFDILRQAASPSAYHSFVGRPDPGKCYPDTRVDLLEGLEKWSLGMELPENLFDAGLDRDGDIDETDQLRNLPIIWLRGGAGAGKSAVAQTFAERCEDLGHIVASFFFFSTDSTRNTANRLVATLAYQIAQADPDARARIETIVHHNPQIFDQDFRRQIVSLLVTPILSATRTLDAEGQRRQCIVIIDGLDECTGGEVQAGIVRAVSDALCAGSADLTKPLPRFLICSRPEEPITRVFRSPHLQNMYTSVNLSRDTNADHDIHIFLNGKLAEIKATHDRADLIPDSWPSNYDLSRLVYNSSGHFIYAETVVRLLSNDPRPVATLEAMLGLRALPQRVRDPFAELDELYRHILLRALNKCSINVILRVLGFLSAGFPLDPVHPDVIADFLDLDDGELDTLLSTVSSLISVTPLTGRRQRAASRLGFYHKAFNDFLQHRSSAREFYIAVNVVHAFVWDRCLDVASKTTSLHLNNDIFRVAMLCLSTIPDHHGSDGAVSNPLLGLTQRRQLSPIFRRGQRVGNFGATWASNCFRYWCKLTDGAPNNCQLVKDATAIMIGIIKALVPLSTPGLPLLICKKLTTDLLVDGLPSSLDSTPLSWLVYAFWSKDRPRSACFERFLEDEEMGECRLTGARFAEACLFWTTHLTKNANLFSSNIKTVLQNQRSVIMNEPARRQRTPFLWRRMKQTVRPHQITGRASFLHCRQVFHIKPRGESGHIYKVHYGYTNRELFFGSRSNLTLQRKCYSSLTEENWHLRPAWWGGLKATTWNKKKTPVSGYTKIRFSGLFFFVPREKIAEQQFLGGGKDLVANSRESEHSRRQEFKFILHRLPIMLAKASKLDAVAALRSRAFPPLARCFPGLMRRVKRALEEYAARHGYDSPYIDAGTRYTGTGSIRLREDLAAGNKAAASSTMAPPEEIVPPQLALIPSTPPRGEKRRRNPPPQGTAARRICAEPGCRSIIRKDHGSVTCISPDCHRRYHLSCREMDRAALSDWFCDEACERDAAVRKRVRYM